MNTKFNTRTIVALITLILFATLLSACGGKDGNSTSTTDGSTPEAKAEEKVERAEFVIDDGEYYACVAGHNQEKDPISWSYNDTAIALGAANACDRAAQAANNGDIVKLDTGSIVHK